jgi:hypothetical protein
MHSVFETTPAASAIPITFATKASWESICAQLPGEARLFAQANGFAAKPGAYLALPAADGRLAHILFGLEDESSSYRDPFRPGALPGLLPPGVYRFATTPVWPRWRSRSAPIASGVTARPMRPTSGWCRRMASTLPPSRAWRRPPVLPAT